MNILDKHYPEISFKTDAEDLRVMIDFINECARLVVNSSDLQVKSSLSLIKEIRFKMIVKEEQKRGTTKKFLVKFKPYHIWTLLNLFSQKNDEINIRKFFEYNCIMQYRDMFHQKLTGL
jgi:hypothetical protein